MERPDIAPGMRIAEFRIGELLQRGGMASIYAAERAPADGPLVMKRPHMGFGSHPACYVYFESEQMILATLSGAHVPRLVARSESAADPWLVMERIEGPSLAEYARRAPLEAGAIARLMSAAANAVHDLHRQNVVHLDLKPSHIRFRPDGTAVLIDFGLARHAHLPDLGGEEFPVPAGTGACIAPEQLAGIRSDPRSDIYALGVIAYQLATGVRPFGEPTTVRAMRRRLYRDPLPPRALNAALPAWLQEVILRCLETHAADRYASAAQLAHDFAFPEQIPLGARAGRLRRPGWLTVLRRRLRARPPDAPATPAAQLARAPHLLVALEPDHDDAALAAALREALRRAAIAEPGLRVTLFSALRAELFAEDGAGEILHAQHVATRVALRHWIAPLGLAAEQLRLHVAPASDVAAAILDYAAAHRVDRILLGARGASRLRRYLGSVSSRVVAQAPCSVSVIRPRRPAAK